MNNLRRSLLVLSTIFAVASTVRAEDIPAAVATETVDVWMDSMPGRGAAEPEGMKPATGDGVMRFTNVSKPTLAFYKAKSDAPTPVIIVSPGGGYGILAYNKEGTEIAAWLNSIGVSAAVLKYRVPNNREGAFQDIQRAIRLVRSKEIDWNIDPARVGVMGFSAGGHLSARAVTGFETAAYKETDGVDKLSPKPNFAVLVYPAFLNKEEAVAAELPISATLPPILILHAEDDKNFIKGSKVFHAALTEAKANAEIQIFASGGHGHGLRSKKEVGVWPERCKEWLVKQGFLKEAGKQ